MKKFLTSVPGHETALSFFVSWQEFVEKFRLLLPKGAANTSEPVTELFEKLQINKSSYQIGKTKVSVASKSLDLCLFSPGKR